jgi:hypothetical protein
MSIYSLAFAGVMPIGSILSGSVADAIGSPAALVLFSAGTVVLGVFSPRFGVPHLDDVVAPEYSEERSTPHDDATYDGGPVVVLNTWQIDEADFSAFTTLMNEVRLVRLTTGAYRWRLFRNTSDPTRFTEFMALTSWEEHMAQHARIDDAAAALLRRARAFDRGEGPVTRHLIAIDVEDPPDFEAMVATHDELHMSDGSIPTTDQES